MSTAEQPAAAPDPQELREIEQVAVELANLAGAEITMALGTILKVRYKSGSEDALRDPVSEVDNHVEQVIRARLANAFPVHGIIGEELDDRPPQDSAYVWAVDPVDGTVNFVNGFPMFAAAIGVLYHGRPVVGALWCATSHALRPGVYHGAAGGHLRFEDEQVEPRGNPAVRRRLAGAAHIAPGVGTWDKRKTGSAALECAFVAAGLLEAARFETPNIWDVAGGLALVGSTGGAALTQEKSGTWERFAGFPDGNGDIVRLRGWSRPLIVGRSDAQTLIAGLGAGG